MHDVVRRLYSRPGSVREMGVGEMQVAEMQCSVAGTDGDLAGNKNLVAAVGLEPTTYGL
jgi:hypothetical protein